MNTKPLKSNARKRIRLDLEAYRALVNLRRPGESNSDVVVWLIDQHRILLGLEPILRGSHAFHEFMKTREKPELAGRISPQIQKSNVIVSGGKLVRLDRTREVK